MSKIKVDTIEGSTGTTITVPSGQTLTVTDGIAATNLSGTIADARLPTVPVAKGGTVLTSLGTANQVVAVNSSANALEFQDAGSGGIAQVKQTVKTNSQVISSTSDVDIMSIAITPTNSSHKVLVSWSVNASSNDHAALFVVRGSTTIYLGDASGSRLRCAHGFYGDNQADMIQTYSGSFLDSPNTTSATTYYIKGRTPASSSHDLYINRSRNDLDRVQNQRTASHITVMEVTV